MQADNIIINSKLSGSISDLAVQNNWPVKAGEVLARIDDRDYQTSGASAQANLNAAAANIDNLTQHRGQQNDAIAEAHAAANRGTRREDSRHTS